jgi:Mg/Co/Ni transporter MgtE
MTKTRTLTALAAAATRSSAPLPARRTRMPPAIMAARLITAVMADATGPASGFGTDGAGVCVAFKSVAKI